ncbi:hypothetical protein RhiirA1_479661 [Rhizophagus irregularis]|nr:hypothetical protein RhiirA1_479661 [Rhizophagus irregularis]
MNLQTGSWNRTAGIFRNHVQECIYSMKEYAIGNTYGFNLLKNLDISAIISDKSYTATTETSTIRTTSQNTI